MKTFPFSECVLLRKRLGLRCFDAVTLLYCSLFQELGQWERSLENAGGLPDPARRSIVPRCGLDRAQNTIVVYSVLSKF